MVRLPFSLPRSVYIFLSLSLFSTYEDGQHRHDHQQCLLAPLVEEEEKDEA